MNYRRRRLVHPDDRGPLRVMFVLTSMPVGGAETLLVNLVRRMDRTRFEPELCCLKTFGPLGEVLSQEMPAFTGLLQHKYDLAVLPRLTRLLRQRRIDAVVTVGTGGDRMFWGRLAAWCAGVPVVLSAIHSTGYPNHVELPNRLLAPWTDGFIAVAEPHGRYLATHEGCRADKVSVIPNGVDVERFSPRAVEESLRREIALPADAPVAAIVAALRPEKNHELFLRAAAEVLKQHPTAQFLVIGDGPQRSMLEALAGELGTNRAVHFLGTRHDVPELLALSRVLVLSSHMEANPVSILEAMACGVPVVATRVGSVDEAVHDGSTGYLTEPGNAAAIAERIAGLFDDPERAQAMGRVAREHVVARWSLEQMVQGYEDLIHRIYTAKCPPLPSAPTVAAPDRAPTATPLSGL
ncbi:MAG TPA: glycosyltransferase [Pirellulales bacterium]|jgi:glycosyltransferase involved in cell wall biosynthesis|nr:glycosyltransferase [Pirellulales bacterium]